MYLGMALMLVSWWASAGAIALALTAVGFGLFYGGFVATFPTVVMDLFGARSVSGIIGCIYTAAGIGTLIGPPLAGASLRRVRQLQRADPRRGAARLHRSRASMALRRSRSAA